MDNDDGEIVFTKNTTDLEAELILEKVIQDLLDNKVAAPKILLQPWE